MDIVFSDFAEKELERLPQELKSLFLKHFEKMIVAPPRKCMKHGIPCHVDKVTGQARIVCEIRRDTIYVLHCFGSHKDFQPTGPTGSDILKVPSRIRLFSSSASLTALSRSD